MQHDFTQPLQISFYSLWCLFGYNHYCIFAFHFSAKTCKAKVVIFTMDAGGTCISNEMESGQPIAIAEFHIE